jgi:hypothetical protein
MSGLPENSRGLVEPFAALAALFAVCVGLSMYAVVLADAGAVGESERDVAAPTLTAVHDAVTVGGIVLPARLDRALAERPTGLRLAVVLRTADRRWTVGPPLPAATDRTSQAQAQRPVSVRLGPGRLDVGRLRVVVW